MSEPLLTLPASKVDIYRFGGEGCLQFCTAGATASIFASPDRCTIEPAGCNSLSTHHLCITGAGVDVRVPITGAAEADQLLALLATLREVQ